MTKKARRNSTAQGFAGITKAQFHHNYMRSDKSNAADYANLRHSFLEAAKPAADGMVHMHLNRNQRRLAKKLNIELTEVQ